MIHLTRINGTGFVLNSGLIEQIEATPDTVITLTSGHNYMVLEPPEEIIRRTIDFRKLIFQGRDCLFETGASAGDHGSEQ